MLRSPLIVRTRSSLDGAPASTGGASSSPSSELIVPLTELAST